MSGGGRGAAASAASVSAASSSACTECSMSVGLRVGLEQLPGAYSWVPCALGLQNHAALHVAWLRSQHGAKIKLHSEAALHCLRLAQLLCRTGAAQATALGNAAAQA